MTKAWNGGKKTSLGDQLRYVAETLGNVRIMVNRGHGDVDDIPDPVCAEAISFINTIATEVDAVETRADDAERQLRDIKLKMIADCL